MGIKMGKEEDLTREENLLFSPSLFSFPPFAVTTMAVFLLPHQLE